MCSKTRNVVVFGRKGVGKTTVLRKLLDEDLQHVVNKDNPVENVNGKLDQITVKAIDTFSTCELSSCMIMKALVDRKIIASVSNFLGSVHLVLFIVRSGRFLIEDRETFRSVFYHYGESIRRVSATIITHCDHEIRENVKYAFENSPETKEFASSMGKGVYTVAFPDSKDFQCCEKDVQDLRSLLKYADESVSLHSVWNQSFLYILEITYTCFSLMKSVGSKFSFRCLICGSLLLMACVCGRCCFKLFGLLVKFIEGFLSSISRVFFPSIMMLLLDSSFL